MEVYTIEKHTSNPSNLQLLECQAMQTRITHIFFWIIILDSCHTNKICCFLWIFDCNFWRTYVTLSIGFLVCVWRLIAMLYVCNCIRLKMLFSMDIWLRIGAGSGLPCNDAACLDLPIGIAVLSELWAPADAVLTHVALFYWGLKPFHDFRASVGLRFAASARRASSGNWCWLAFLGHDFSCAAARYPCYFLFNDTRFHPFGVVSVTLFSIERVGVFSPTVSNYNFWCAVATLPVGIAAFNWQNFAFA